MQSAILVAAFAASAPARADVPPSCADDDHLCAAAALRRELEQGELAPERRAEIEERLAIAERGLARVEVISDVVGVEVRIDGACAFDATTYAPACTSNGGSRVLVVNPGERRLTARHPRFRNVEHVFTVAAGGELRVRLNAPNDQQNPYREKVWSAWCIAGVLVPATAALGIRTAVAEGGIDSPLGVATVGLGVGALIAIGVATYLTIQSSRWQPR